MKSLLPLLFAVTLFFSCSKEEYPRVEYRVNASGSSEIAYTMVSPSVSQENVTGSWSVSFRHSKGASLFLSAVHTGIGTTTIEVYVNKELLYSEATQVPGELIVIAEATP
jgi:hypothetical protein